MNEPAFPYTVFLSHSAQDKAVLRPLPVAAARQSAENLPAHLACDEEEDGAALPSRRHAEAIKEGLEHSQFTFQLSAFSLSPKASWRNSWDFKKIGL